MSNLNWTFSQKFLSQFQILRAGLATRVDAIKITSSIPPEVIQTLSLDLAKLTKSLVDATGSLPGFDQRQCESQLKDLERKLEELRASVAPKPKFAFKRPAPGPTHLNIPPSEPKLSIQPSAKGTALVPPPSANLSLSSHSHSYLTFESLPDTPASRHSNLTISDLNGCIVNLLPSSSASQDLNISAIHIRNVTNTVLLLPIINGSIIMHELSKCVVVVGCHQFRAHNSNHVDVYLSVLSNPVIEQSSQMRFSGYPSSLSSQSVVAFESNHFSVQDFSHIRATSSPNWSLLPNEAHTTKWPVLAVGGDELKEALERLLVSDRRWR
jgi:hypothetical protein